MRVRPNALIAIALAVGYMAIVAILWLVTGSDYTRIAESPSTLLLGIVLPVGVGAVFLAIAASVLGWWQPALFEKRAGSGWMWIAPVVMLIAGTSTLVARDVTQLNPVYVLTLAAGVALVGFSEEMLTRGLGLVGFRGSLNEGWAWFASCLTFGLIHGLNLVFGQAFAPTAQQIVTAFFSASVFYVLRRVSGSLIWAMVLHAIWDFCSLSAATIPPGPLGILALLSFLQYAAQLVALIAVWRLIVADREAAKTTVPAAQG
jgi:hypothetical protein